LRPRARDRAPVEQQDRELVADDRRQRLHADRARERRTDRRDVEHPAQHDHRDADPEHGEREHVDGEAIGRATPVDGRHSSDIDRGAAQSTGQMEVRLH
jgi:hypothetical protein